MIGTGTYRVNANCLHESPTSKGKTTWYKKIMRVLKQTKAEVLRIETTGEWTYIYYKS